MLQRINIKGFFKLSLITIFTTLLFLGTAGVNTALANEVDIVEGKLVIKQVCQSRINTKPFKRTIKSAFTMTITKSSGNQQGTEGCGPGCLSPYPSWDDIRFFVEDFFVDGTPNTFLKASNPWAAAALTTNLKNGTFKSVVWDTQNITLSLSGTIVTDKKTGVTKKIVGKIDAYTFDNSGCLYVGKFKSTRVFIQQ